ncbi:MAG: atoC [Phycisphaerales bacterium]|nr:atoC [Phycisphaerales bacterium]
MPVAAKPVSSPAAAARPRVLVVDDEPALAELLADVARSLDCTVTVVGTVADARLALSAGPPVHLLVTDVHLPDGDGTALLDLLKDRHPTARAIVVTGDPTVAAATAALRLGAVDFVPKPFDHHGIVARVRSALDVQVGLARQELKLKKLKAAVRKLNGARKTISQKVDILCNDLVTAYGELSKQFDVVRTQEGFRKTIAGSTDLEQLICQSMDWLMRQVGYSNVAVWLAGEDGAYQLGAYMKYTIPGDPPVGDALRRAVLPQVSRDGRDAPVRIRSADLAALLTPAERPLLKDQEVLAIECTYLGEPLAALVFFRDEQVPFGEQDADTMRAVGPVFASALAAIVRQGAGDEDGEPTGSGESSAGFDGPLGEADAGGGDTLEPKKRKPSKPDPADWWKRGETPPF